MMRLSKAPVIASHSSARALNDVSRNLDDEQLMMIKEKGGVVQTVAFKSYVNSEKDKANNEKAEAIIAEVAKAEGFEMLERSAMRDLTDEARETYYKGYLAIRDKAKDRIEKEVNPSCSTGGRGRLC
jgi:membrane dipeptidase